ncbi:MAG: FAD-binding oxidoreductase [Pseudomonadales bacterium]|nr:FAD-binding oxidoreductase [Pseudomonadales bacterium]
MTKKYQSWGMYPKVEQDDICLTDRYQNLPADCPSMLPFGNGRSYGDSCLNADGLVVDTRYLNNFISFDSALGLLRCEAGLLLSEILELVVPQGWFLPVTPGTKYVTVGGAIANDVHGKNHHVAGTFGCHVKRFELLRSDGERLCCSPTEHVDFFAATIGGLGLTGMIVWAEFQLQRITSSDMDMECIKYDSLEDFFLLSAESDLDYEYSMAWVDCTAKGSKLGRGHFLRGNHANTGGLQATEQAFSLSVPVVPPVSLVNSLTLRVFNTLYYERQRQSSVKNTSHYESFFYPLDWVLRMNRIYGPNGFQQYQCVIPRQQSEDAIREILTAISFSGMGSFLAVLKVCGDIDSPGLMSFPKCGTTLALDFSNNSSKTAALFKVLDEILIAAEGRLYPAKDAHMSGELFKSCYPNWGEVCRLKDPNFSSSFWRRVMQE